MKREKSIFKKSLALVLGIIMLIGLLPFNAMAAETTQGLNIVAVQDTKGITATVYNYTSEDAEARLIFAVYELDGSLSYVKEYLLPVGEGKSEIQRFDYESAFEISDELNNVIKLFAWDNLSYIPIEVSDILFVKIDNKKRGAVYTIEKSGNEWVYTKATGVDLILAYKPANVVGGALPSVKVTDLRLPNGANTKRIVVSLQ